MKNKFFNFLALYKMFLSRALAIINLFAPVGLIMAFLFRNQLSFIQDNPEFYSRLITLCSFIFLNAYMYFDYTIFYHYDNARVFRVSEREINGINLQNFLYSRYPRIIPMTKEEEKEYNRLMSDFRRINHVKT